MAQANTSHTDDPQQSAYNINIFHIKTSKNSVLPKLKSNRSNDFRASVIVNNCLSSPIADTGAKVSVCGTQQAKRWNLLSRMIPSQVKLKPYNNEPIPVTGTARCSVTFGARSVPVGWHIISGSCEPVLSSDAAMQLGIIKFSQTPDIFQPIRMIDQDAVGESKEAVQAILQEYPQNFTGLGRLKNHQIKLHVKNDVKPVRDAPRPFP